MKFVYGKQDMADLKRAQENCFLLTNGLGGFCSMTAAFSATRNDHGILLSARTAPNDRVNLVHRLSEKLMGKETVFLSTQEFADGTTPEEGYLQLSDFVWENGPVWHYEIGGVTVTRRCAMGFEKNITAVCYTVENRSKEQAVLEVTPWMQFASKGNPPQEKHRITFSAGKVTGNGLSMQFKTNGVWEKFPTQWQRLHYAHDVKDGRRSSGLVSAGGRIYITVAPGENEDLEILFSDKGIRTTGEKLLAQQEKRLIARQKQGNFKNEIARQLAAAAADYIAHRDSTGGKTILAGFPFFGDWGRDTMIALPGCTLAREDYDTAASILRTFLAYEQDGLVPNLFPEGNNAPMYNTVDAALLLVGSIWLYYQRTKDIALLKEAFPVMERIVAAYQKGTRHGIHMDTDGLICAGQGMDQVTWMDVCVEGILPTPRHGKPVEINAYWYNALMVMSRLAPLCGKSGESYEALAKQVAESFRETFWLEKEGYLKDVISGTTADMQLRCNQIWAVTMPFGMLTKDQERRVVETVYRHLYTPVGLRTLSSEDPEFKPNYGGCQKDRDLAYHQGTVWPFPLGAYYLAYLKVHDNSPAAKATVYRQLEPLRAALREGCVGQLPEIYEGLHPGASQGCFAQAWSVGELLRVFEALEKGYHYET
ncbi:MAG: glycogen debranching enzyme family protein [Oscillospiraceae bacterium]|nr:glycogen debranching enzyme family protein [Oscillospiraceae bacterium]